MRAMPSLNKIAMSLQEFRFAKPLVESILIELQYNDETIQKYAVFRDKGPLYIAKGSINFNGKKIIDLCIESNASILVTGPSGCGKSTLLKSLMGLDKKLDEVSFYRELDKTIKIAFLTSSTPLFKMTLIENILLGREIKKQELLSIIDICRLQEFDLLGEGGQRIVEENNFKPSSGEIQRLILARALVQQPKFLLLDEALSAIDRENYFLIEKKLLTTFQGVLIHVSHYYSDPKNYTHFIYADSDSFLTDEEHTFLENNFNETDFLNKESWFMMEYSKKALLPATSMFAGQIDYFYNKWLTPSYDQWQIFRRRL
jgi:ABC-type bacteriocin/lantibiotic exporter with double-glycine peptidase domain